MQNMSYVFNHFMPLHQTFSTEDQNQVGIEGKWRDVIQKVAW